MVSPLVASVSASVILGATLGSCDCATPASDPAKACDDGDMQVCANLGVAYASGQGVPKDESKAAELFTKACGGGSQQACMALKSLE